ncbi:uncharacterized protein LOC132463704 isoform X1 [Gadus macrocephalus]|uniref:uncharacterized protein LOC132463704 isoform X1 n=1 Tax=Gadus macrocephalus TaxID=80720 RepID=UPI0028CB2DE3|nr:uncharacterized protein LOC132463704 isoform X1 [Gadus macrocephalus]
MNPYSVILSVLYVFSFWFTGLQGYTNNSLFLLKGNDLVMKIETLKSKVDVFHWKRTIGSKEFFIITYYTDEFKKNLFGERAEFSTVNYSLQIKNLALNESGLYQALDASKDVVILADYHVTVQEQVSPVVLNVSSVSPSPESCKVTVNCSTQSSSLNSTFTCTNQTCSEDGGDPAEVVTSDVSLQLYLSNGLNAICNHSNKVSWSKATMEIKPLCFEDDDIPHINPRQEHLLIIIPCFLVILILVGILGAIYKQRKKNKRNINSPGSDDRSPNGDHSPTVYSMLGPSSIPLEPIPPQTAVPEGIYAQVEKHGRA